MFCILLRCISVPIVVAMALALTTLNPTHLVCPAIPDEEEVYELADNPELMATQRDLNTRLEVVSERVTEKGVLTQRLLAGQIRLVEVADEFLWLNAQPPVSLDMMRFNFPASTDRESAALCALKFAQHQASPTAWSQARNRLAAEYRAAFRSNPQL